MKKNFKLIIIYIIVTIIFPLGLSFYLASGSKNYFLSYNILGPKKIFQNKFNIYNTISQQVGNPYSSVDDKPTKDYEIIKKELREAIYNYPNVKSKILELQEIDLVILRGEKKDLENLNFENYLNKIEENVYNYFIRERDQTLKIIEKIKYMREENLTKFKERISQFQINNEKDINLIFDIENLNKMDLEEIINALNQYGKNQKSDYTFNRLNREVLFKMSYIISELEKSLIKPYIKLDNLNDIISELNENKYFYSYESLGGKDKSINIILDHFIKFFILANICMVLLNPIIYKKAYKLLNVQS